jgi:hypothetical protein
MLFTAMPRCSMCEIFITILFYLVLIMCLYGIKQHKERQFLPNKEIFLHLIAAL